jgi:hypothetical protein
VEDFLEESKGRGKLAVMIKRSGFRLCKDSRDIVLIMFELVKGNAEPTE